MMMSFHRSFLVSLLILSQVPFTQTCRIGFTESSSSTCMKLIYKSSGFDTVLEANAACNSIETYMARMLTAFDRSLMANMLQKLKDVHGMAYAYAFLGGSDISQEGNFVWTNGINISNFWYNNEPNNWKGYRGEDCVVVDENGDLNDIPCCFKWPRNNVNSVICEYDPLASKQYANDDVFYEKCGVARSTIPVQISSEYIQSSSISADGMHPTIASRNSSTFTQVPFIEESISPSSVVGCLPVTSQQESLSDEFTTTGQEGSILSSTTENLGTPLVMSSSIIEEPLLLTSGLDTANTELLLTIRTMNQTHQTSESYGSRNNIGTTEYASSEFHGNSKVIDLNSPLFLNTSLDLTSITTGPGSSSDFISVTSTQRENVTQTNQYMPPTLPSLNVSHRAEPLIPQPRLRCSSKNQTLYKTDSNVKKVDRKETQRFKRKLSCAKDDRMSSRIIGVVSCLLLLACYLFIVVTDLLKILNKQHHQITQ